MGVMVSKGWLTLPVRGVSPNLILEITFTRQELIRSISRRHVVRAADQVEDTAQT